MGLAAKRSRAYFTATVAIESFVQHSRTVAPDLWKRYVTLVLDGMRSHDEFGRTMK